MSVHYLSLNWTFPKNILYVPCLWLQGLLNLIHFSTIIMAKQFFLISGIAVWWYKNGYCQYLRDSQPVSFHCFGKIWEIWVLTCAWQCTRDYEKNSVEVTVKWSIKNVVNWLHCFCCTIFRQWIHFLTQLVEGIWNINASKQIFEPDIWISKD